MITPPLLKQNDKIRIIAPSGMLREGGLNKALETLESWKLDVSVGNYLFAQNSVFAGSDKQRLHDFQEAINDQEIKLILCARGGYGLTRYIDSLNLDSIASNPKWVVGFSDITVFHLSALKNSMLSIHGPMGTSFSRHGAKGSIDELHNLLFKGTSKIETNGYQIRAGRVQGTLVGGNLALLCDSIGTASEIETDDTILVLEDVGEYYYRIDRMLNQLFRAGKLDKLKGLVIGNFSDLSNSTVEFCESVKDIIMRLTANKKYPIAYSMPIGHEPENYPFVHGAEYQLEVKNNSARLELITKL